MKCGEILTLSGIHYMFLGYTDYKRKYGLLADKHGNKHIHYFGGFNLRT